MRRFAGLLVLFGACAFPAKTAKLVLIAGPPSHGEGEHEFNAGILLLEKCLRQNPGVATAVVKGGWPEDERILEGANAIVLYMDGGAGHPILKASAWRRSTSL